MPEFLCAYHITKFGFDSGTWSANGIRAPQKFSLSRNHFLGLFLFKISLMQHKQDFVAVWKSELERGSQYPRLSF